MGSIMSGPWCARSSEGALCRRPRDPHPPRGHRQRSGRPVPARGYCTAAVMRPLADELPEFTVHAPERPAHGRTPDRPGPMSYDDGVADTLAYLDATGLDAVDVVGFSDGAIIGLLLARDHPDRVRSLVAISANLHPGDDVWVGEEHHARAMPADQSALLDREYAELAAPARPCRGRDRTADGDVDRAAADLPGVAGRRHRAGAGAHRRP